MALVRGFPHRVCRAVHHVGVVTQAANHDVDARATIKAIITVAAIQVVVTTPSRQHVVACQSIDGVGDASAEQNIVVRGAVNSGHGCSPFTFNSIHLRRQGDAREG